MVVPVKAKREGQGMKTKPSKQVPGEVCDTVSRTLPAQGPSSIIDPRAFKSGQALRTAFLALLEHKPFEQITIREIAVEAGVHYATFFRHYTTKGALLDDVAAEQIDRLVALTMPALEASDSAAAFLGLATYVDEHRELWTTLLTGGAAAAMRAEWLRISKRVAAELAPKDGWIPVELAVVCTVSLIIEIITWWLAQKPDALSIEQVAAILHRLVLLPA